MSGFMEEYGLPKGLQVGLGDLVWRCQVGSATIYMAGFAAVKWACAEGLLPERATIERLHTMDTSKYEAGSWTECQVAEGLIDRASDGLKGQWRNNPPKDQKWAIV